MDIKAAKLISKRLILALKNLTHSNSKAPIIDDISLLKDQVRELLNHLPIDTSTVLLERITKAPRYIHDAVLKISVKNPATHQLATVLLTALIADLCLLNSNSSSRDSLPEVIRSSFNLPTIADFTPILSPLLTVGEINHLSGNFTTISKEVEDVKITATLDLLLRFNGKTVKRSWVVLDGILGIQSLFRDTFPSSAGGDIYFHPNNEGQSYILVATDKLLDKSLLEIQCKDGALDRIESKMNLIQSQIQGIHHKDLTLSLEYKEGIRKQLKAITSMRTALLSTRRQTQSMFAEMFADLESSRSKIFNIQAKRPAKIENAPDLDQLSQEIKDFSCLLETCRSDISKGCRPGVDYLNHIQKKLDNLPKRLLKANHAAEVSQIERKVGWETSLKVIMTEQRLASDSNCLAKILGEELDQASDLAKSIIPILAYQLANPTHLHQPSLHVWNHDQVVEFGMKSVMTELNSSVAPSKGDIVNQIVDEYSRIKLQTWISAPMKVELSEYITNHKL